MSHLSPPVALGWGLTCQVFCVYHHSIIWDQETFTSFTINQYTFLSVLPVLHHLGFPVQFSKGLKNKNLLNLSQQTHCYLLGSYRYPLSRWEWLPMFEVNWDMLLQRRVHHCPVLLMHPLIVSLSFILLASHKEFNWLISKYIYLSHRGMPMSWCL